MDERDGDGADASGIGRFHLLDRLRQIDRPLHGAVRQHPLVDLDDTLVKLVGLDDVAGKDMPAILITELQYIAKAARGHENRAIALALQQRVGRNRGSHPDLVDQAGGDGLVRVEPEMGPDARHGRIAVCTGILRQHLARVQPALRVATDHIGERAAAVDPEIPA